MIECGAEIRVQDIYNATAIRFVGQCGGRYIVIAHGSDYRNGYLLSGWRGVLRELITLTVPAKMIDKTMRAEASPEGRYVSLPLTYPLSVKALADLLAAELAEVRAELADLAVTYYDDEVTR